jgi:putative hemolysin
MGLDLPEGEYDTLAGFLLEHLGRLPEQGEHISIGNVQFRVLEMKGLKIERVLVTRVRPAEA